MRNSLVRFFSLRRFAPLFGAQFLGALNDHLLKNAIAVFIVYRLSQEAGLDGNLLVALGAAIFVLPFFLFSTLAGQVADRYAKSRVIKALKGIEIGLMAAAAAALLWGNVWALLGVLFLMGAQSAFFSPAKYALLPEALHDNELVAGNGIFEAGVYLAILAGTIVGAQLILVENGPMITAVALVVIAVLGYLSAMAIPASRQGSPDIRISANIPCEIVRIVGHAKKNHGVFLAILGSAWFWTVGVVYLTEFPTYARSVLGANEDVVTLFLALFSVGIGLGSLACDRLLKGEVEATWVPVGALGIALFSADLFFASEAARVVGATVLPENQLRGIGAFLSDPASWRVVADLLGVAFCGGLYAVPLYAIIQHRTEEAHRSRTLAANNIVCSFFTVAGAAAVAGLVSVGMEVMDIFLIFAVLAVFVAVYICALLPASLIKAVLSRLFAFLYRVEVVGRENLKAAGGKAVIVVNHASYLDGALLGAMLPGYPVFAVNEHWLNKWWVKLALRFVDVYGIDPMKPMGVRGLIRNVQDGQSCVIFPEGRLTRTGAVMKVYEGPGVIAEKGGAPIVPVHIEGAQYTTFSKLRGKVRRRLFPKLKIVIHPPVSFDLADDLKGRARRAAAADKLYEILAEATYQSCDTAITLFDALVEARHLHGGRFKIVEGVERRPMSYDRLIRSSLVLAHWLRKRSAPGDAIGLMLPTSQTTCTAFFACQAAGRVPAMMNFSAGAAAVGSAVETASMRLVLTSRQFVERARMAHVVDAVKAAGADVVYLEDVRDAIGPLAKIGAAFGSLRRKVIHIRKPDAEADKTAAILFTSGSEGKPKAVALSHRNLMSNRWQITARIDFTSADKVFNALPVFHAFGLMGGLLIPVLSGVPSFQYPSPLHYRVIPELVYDTDATILFATDTFLSGYARMAHPYDFYAVRYIFAGAERVRDETRKIWSDKFGIRLLEGYGVTETAPVIAVSSPMHNRHGSVGRFLPGIAWRLASADGIEAKTPGRAAGRLQVRGPNVMVGYLDATFPDGVNRPEDGWYDTGDIVEVDGDGFIYIIGRLKRFAKIGGEMVSLGMAEELAQAAWPDHVHAAVALPDAKKGERVVLATTCGTADRDALASVARHRGLPEIAIPKEVVPLDAIPLLASGKTDYPTLTGLVSARN